MKVQVSIALILALTSISTLAYDPRTHGEMAAKACDDAGIVNNKRLLGRMGIEQGAVFPSSQGKALSVAELCSFGASFEDDRQPIQALYHFFDPANLGRGLTLRSILGGTLVTPGLASPDWALEDKGLVVDMLGKRNPFSYRQARQYFYNALTSPTKPSRDISLGLTFQSLGHIVHHLQDMAQPQHARNDMHCDYLFPCLFPGQLFFEGTYRKARYEDYGIDPPDEYLRGYAPVFTKGKPNNIRTARNFWHTQPPGNQAAGRGIAEFSNTNFVTDGTNFEMRDGVARASSKYALPLPGAAEDVSIAAAFKSAPVPPGIRAICDFDPSGCFLTFYSSQVRDNLTGQTELNKRASTYSLFDGDLQGYGATVKLQNPTTGEEYTTQKVFSLNRFNFERMQELLLPRAVGYSAGFINFFFRADIDLHSHPDDPTAFRLKNLTNEKMRGTFRLFYDTAAGERLPVPGAVWENVALDPSDANDPASGFQVTITTPTDPAPAKPGEYMLVFNGDLGDEKAGDGDVGVVTGRQVKLTGELLLLSQKVLFSSRDNGATWQFKYSTGNDKFVALNHVGQDTLISLDQVSRDGGETFQPIPNDPFALPCRTGGVPNGSGAIVTVFLPDQSSIPSNSPDSSRNKYAVSTDDGATCIVGGHVNLFNGASLVPMGGGRLIANSFRPDDGPGGKCEPPATSCRTFIPGTYYSGNGGLSWTHIADSNFSAARLFLGRTRSSDSGISPDPAGEDTILGFHVPFGDPDEAVFRLSRDLGRTWDPIGYPNELRFTFPSHRLTQMTYAGHGKIFAVFMQGQFQTAKLFHSPDYGKTWTAAGTLPFFARQFGINAMVYVGPRGSLPGFP